MSTNTRLLVIATVSALALGFAAYIFLGERGNSPPPDVDSLLKELPTAASTDTINGAEEWTQGRAIGRYDNMQRAGDSVLGRWATTIKDACIAAQAVTSIPNEKSWKKPVTVYQCFDGATVFEIELEN